MSADPITLSVTMKKAASSSDVLDALRWLPLGGSARFEQRDSQTLLVRSGSRLRYRLFGTWGSSAQLPARWTFTLAPEGTQTRVEVSLTSDEGWYLVQTPLAQRAYRRRFEEVLAFMEAKGFVRCA